MHVSRLEVDGIRNLDQVCLLPEPGINLIIGENGAGKTSLLEALHCLSRGRSFRASGRHEYLNRDRRFARIVACVKSRSGEVILGMERSPQHWRARAGGEELQTLGDLAQFLPFTLFHPGMHVLIEGGPEERRQFVDFGVFHVEQAFFQHWRRYRQALRQRNAALRQVGDEADPTLWDEPLVTHGLALHSRRSDHVAQLAVHFDQLLHQLAPELCPVELELAPGWPEATSLSEALSLGLAQDREQSFTRYGPHRADLRIQRKRQRVAGRLSRGQQKLVALALMMAQSRCLSEGGVTPVMGFDDLPSELDRDRQERLLSLLRELGAQVWITGTERPAGAKDHGQGEKVFHVKHGQVTTAE